MDGGTLLIGLGLLLLVGANNMAQASSIYRDLRTSPVPGKSYQGPALTRVWEYSTTRERTIAAASHLETILAMVRPHFQEFRRLIIDKSLDVDLQLSVQLAAGESPAGYVDAIRIAELAAMGAGLDIQLRSRE
jgi:Domain of unknown function (DUF4279)